MFLALWHFTQHMQVAHGWTGVEFAWPFTQDDAGRFELVGNAFEIAGEISNIDDLKKVLASRFLRFSSESAMTINQQSFLVSSMCGDCGQKTSSTELFAVTKVA